MDFGVNSLDNSPPLMSRIESIKKTYSKKSSAKNEHRTLALKFFQKSSKYSKNDKYSKG